MITARFKHSNKSSSISAIILGAFKQKQKSCLWIQWKISVFIKMHPKKCSFRAGSSRRLKMVFFCKIGLKGLLSQTLLGSLFNIRIVIPNYHDFAWSGLFYWIVITYDCACLNLNLRVYLLESFYMGLSCVRAVWSHCMPLASCQKHCSLSSATWSL